MEKPKQSIAVSDEVIMNRIYMIRETKVMLDRDLAELYGVETKQLKRQVKRNKDRFPGDFMFELTEEEFRKWRRQFGTSNGGDKMGLRYAPYAFTEQGVAMLSSVLSSATAIKVNIQIIRIFTRMREILLTHKDILLKLEQLENKVGSHDRHIRKIFKYLKQFLIPVEQVNRRRIGFKGQGS
ncbi:MAG TPA: ORF6N domain-containing protein [Chitinophagaceae bacterium]|nr:ORF6N domain-containing protein [Chitinophagaceae bacterium]